jgi:hypothetical protein
MQAPGPGPREAQFLKGWFIYSNEKNLMGRRLGAPYREKQVQEMVFKSRDQLEGRKREDQEQAEYPKSPKTVSSSIKSADVHVDR